MATSIFKEYFKGYEILGELGRGNARVLKARSLETGSFVAIKHFAFNTDADTLRRFQRESEIMKSISHDNIVKISEVHLDSELPYIVMQLVEGGDLRSLLKNYGTLDIPTTIRLAHHMTEALDAIHTKAVVHRDVKPENIMYRRLPTGELQFLLTDFGIARLREQPDTVTVTGASMLTYDYASPEQFNQSKKVSTPTDYYSLGIVIYECLTGTVPFEYEQDDLLMHINRVISCPVPLLKLPNGGSLPPGLQQLLEGLLAKQSSHRLSDPVQVRHLLRTAAIEDLQGVRAAPPVTPKQTIAYKKRTPKEKREFSYVILALMISVAVFFSWTKLVKSGGRAIPTPVAGNALPPAGIETKHVLQPKTKRDPVVLQSKYTETSEPVVMQETPVIPNPGRPLTNGIYFNDFSDPHDSAWDVGRDMNSEYSITDGKYIMKGLTDSLSYSTALKFDLDAQKDFTIAANTTHHGENADDPFGINFCGDQEQDAYFVFYITSSGYYSIGMSLKDEWKVLVDWTSSSNIRQHEDMNILSVEKQGDSLRFYINDKLERALPFTGGFGNYFGLRVDGVQTVSFDQFIVKGGR
jgi:eukaryotic-like serine/threonine-protein kinase